MVEFTEEEKQFATALWNVEKEANSLRMLLPMYFLPLFGVGVDTVFNNWLKRQPEMPDGPVDQMKGMVIIGILAGEKEDIWELAGLSSEVASALKELMQDRNAGCWLLALGLCRKSVEVVELVHSAMKDNILPVLDEFPVPKDAEKLRDRIREQLKSIQHGS